MGRLLILAVRVLAFGLMPIRVATLVSVAMMSVVSACDDPSPPQLKIVSQSKTYGITLTSNGKKTIEWSVTVRNETDEQQRVSVSCRIPLLNDSIHLAMKPEVVGAHERETLSGVAPLPHDERVIRGNPDCLALGSE